MHKRRASNAAAAGLDRSVTPKWNRETEEKPHTCGVSDPSVALATEVHCEVQKHSDKEENEGQTRGSLLETH